MEYLEITGSPDVAALGSEPGLHIVATAKVLDSEGNQVGWTVLAYAEDGTHERLGGDFDVTLRTDSATTALRLAADLSAFDEGVAVPELPRGDIAAELLMRALLYLRERINVAALKVLRSAQELGAALRVDAGPELDSVFDILISAIDVFSARLENPYEATTLDDLAEAVSEIASGIAAPVGLAGRGAVQALIARILPGALPGPFADVLGLARTVPDFEVDDQSIRLSAGIAQPTLLNALSAKAVNLSAHLVYRGEPSLGVTLTVDGMRLSSATGGSLLALAGLDAVTANLEIGLDTATGFVFGGTPRTGAGALRVPLPPPRANGLVRISRLELTVQPADESLVVSVRGAARGGLGPLALSVDDLGLGLRIDASSETIVHAPEFLAPKGFGVSIEAGPVHGGGFLASRAVPGHPDWTRYDGALTLRLGPVEVAAFAVLTERPGGFSFVAVMSAQIIPPIELGLLFTLNGVGGLIGAEVTANTDAMARSVGTGAISRLLFPDDPAGAAPTILDTLAAFFPPQPDGFVIAPMLRLGWGRPVSFVTADLALVLSLPDPKVLLLGKLRVAIPAPAAPVIDLRAEIYGEFSDDRMLVLASLVDSRIGFFSVAGDLGVLLRLGDDPVFALSAGGFHPRYVPPPELAQLRRVQADISPPLFQLRVEAYAAVTPGVVQFGGAVEIRYGIEGTGIFGHAALDALIRFSPFGFQADMVAGVAIRVAGATIASATLRLHLEGPAPWLAWGTGEVGLPWPLPDLSIDVGPVSWGEARPVEAAEAKPVELVAAALSQRRAWNSVDGAAKGGVVLAEAEFVFGILVDPWSVLTGVQEVVPLDLDIVRVGASRVAADQTRITLGDADFVNIAPDEASGERPQRWGELRQGPVSATFAAGHYLDLTDDELLQRPAFEKSMTGGLTVDPVVLTATPNPVAIEPRYATSFPHDGRATVLSAARASAIDGLALTSTAASLSEVRSRYAATTAESLALADTAQAFIRSATDLSPVPELSDTHMTWSLAHQLTQRQSDVVVVAIGAVAR